ncbi:hypothetical protein GJ688_02690 [Heliobacillus mobilis]|uniref:Uncharacterized protein n=1 Tax=Heliobacterium mobile TaxID=28064 RepID=A0A6I3SFI7_HELMO|nr:hypothetical protein [Heliobacterium mobile]MTV47890.1 hypothetical protein [Heliobacterium mobile]
MSVARNHLLLDKAFKFHEKKGARDPQGCTYDFSKGAWMKEENGLLITLVRSQDPNKPIAGTKKADVETGEDQKGE